MNLRIAMLLAAASLCVGAQDFSKDVQPILERRCQGCHGATQQMSNLRLDSPASMARVLDGKLIERISSTKKGFMMPPIGAPLSAEEIGRIKSWIDAGAKFPAVVAKSTHWSFQPIQRPAKTSIDAFILERLAKENIAPSPESIGASLDSPRESRSHSLPLTPRECGGFRCRPESERL